MNAQFRLSPNIKLFFRTLFDSLICSFNHQIHLLQSEVNIKTKQLSFYRHSLSNIHCQYIRNLIGILSTGQQSFNKQLQTRLYEPLVEIIKEFNRMSNEKTDESLKSFLFTFKIHIDQFNEIVHDLYQQITDGSKGIEQLFIQTNEQMWKEIEDEQKQLLEQIAQMKNEPRESDQEAVDNLVHFFTTN